MTGTGQDPHGEEADVAGVDQGDGGRSPDPEPGGTDDQLHPPRSGADLARQALQQAKADARRRGVTPGRSRGNGTGDRQRGASSPGHDPLSLGGAIEELVSERGWEVQASVASVFARWPDIVGAELAAHARPQSFDDGVLVVVADSAAWATQVRLLSGTLVQRVHEVLGDTAVRHVRVYGPGKGDSTGGRGISGARGS